MIRTMIKLTSLIVLILMIVVGLSWIKTSEGAKAFKSDRKTYHSPGQFWNDISFLMKNRKMIGPTMKGNIISPSFRERLMLVVTSVNNCQSCSGIHTKEGLKAGLEREEIALLLGGVTDNSPGEEIIAIEYAKHWAETDAMPHLAEKKKIEEIYGKDVSDAMELILRMIRLGNLINNTKAYFLYRLSFACLSPEDMDGCSLPI